MKAELRKQARAAKQPPASVQKVSALASSQAELVNTSDGDSFDDWDGEGNPEPTEVKSSSPFSTCSSRYQLVTQRSRNRIYYGVFDSHDSWTRIISENKRDALAELQRLANQKEEKLPYYLRAAAA